MRDSAKETRDTMADDDGTTDEGQQPPADAAATGAAEATATATPTAEDAKWESRARGLDAKVTELVKLQAAADERAKSAEQKLAEYEAGKIGNDEALRAQLAAEQAKTAEAERKAALALIAAQYPETFGVLGDAAAALTTDQLAAAEARFAGSAGGSPTPLRHNGAKTTNGAPVDAGKKPTSQDLIAQLRAMGRPW